MMFAHQMNVLFPLSLSGISLALGSNICLKSLQKQYRVTVKRGDVLPELCNMGTRY